MKTIWTILPWAACCLTTAQAQHLSEKKEYTNFADTTFSIQEVVVETAQQKKPEMMKLNVPMKYLPVSLNQVSGNELEIRGIRDIQEAVRFMPGVRIHTSYGAFQTLYVRGFSNAPIMIDGIRDERTMINSFPFPDLSSIETIELLKGPASVLYGHSAVGGILNVVRKGPKEEQQVNARISYGSYDNKQATVGMGGKLAGPVNYYANVNYADQDGWRHNQNQRFSGYLALSSQLSKQDMLDVRGAFNRDFYGTEIGLPPVMSNDVYRTADETLYLKKREAQPGLDPTARYNNESDYMKNHSWNLMARWAHTFSDRLKLENKLAYFKDDINYLGTEQLSYLESDDPIYNHYYMEGDQKKYICLDTVQLTSPLRFSHIAQTISNQLDLTGKLETGFITHNFLVGYSFSAMARNSYTGYNLGTDVQGPGLYSKVPVHNPHSMGYMTGDISKVYVTHDYFNGIYLQDMLDLDKHWKILLAGRYDFYRYMQATAATPTGKRAYDKADQSAYNTVRASHFTYRVGAVYLPYPSVSIYASMASFFKPIRTFYNQNVIYIDTDGYEFFPQKNEKVFKPESGYQAEAGVKYALGKILQANASLFYIRKVNSTQNLGTKENTVDGSTVKQTITGQVGVMDSKGFDLEATLTPTSTLSLTVGYSFTDARIREMKEVKDKELAEIIYGTTEEQVQASKQKLNSTEGNYQTFIPKNTFYAYADYTIPKGIFKNLSFNLSNTYTDKVYRNAANDRWFEGFWLTDLGASYQLPNRMRISVMVNNLFDKSYYNQALGDQLVPSMPRNYQVAISYNL